MRWSHTRNSVRTTKIALTIDAARPDYIFILPWNLRDEIVHQMRHVADWGGKFVLPIPTVTIIDPKELRA